MDSLTMAAETLAPLLPATEDGHLPGKLSPGSYPLPGNITAGSERAPPPKISSCRTPHTPSHPVLQTHLLPSPSSPFSAPCPHLYSPGTWACRGELGANKMPERDQSAQAC